MNDPKKNESTEAKDETVKEDGEAAEESLDEKDLDGVAGGGITFGGGMPPLPPLSG